MLRLLSFLGLVICMTACATKFQKKGFTGGYEDFEAQPGVHFVSFSGNGYSSKASVAKYWHQRAAEICGGRDRYEVLRAGSEDQKVTVYNYQSNTTYSSGAAHTSTTAVPMTFTKPEMSGYIRCLKQ